MHRERMGGALAWRVVLAMLGMAAWAALAPTGAVRAATYPTMAPVSAYLMDRATEIAMARSAAPPSVSPDAAAAGRHAM